MHTSNTLSPARGDSSIIGSRWTWLTMAVTTAVIIGVAGPTSATSLSPMAFSHDIDVPRTVTSSTSSIFSSAAPQPFSFADRLEVRRQNRLAQRSLHAAAESSSSVDLRPLPRSDTPVGVYMTAESMARKDFLDTMITDLVNAGGSAIIFDVKGGAVLYHSAAPMANEENLVVPIVDLPSVLQKIHDHGLYAIGRFVAIKDGGLTQRMPETKVRNPTTNAPISDTWVDPANQTAIDYNMQVICELAASGIDEINLDYIRFPTDVYQELRVYSGQEKADHVEQFLRATRETINRCGPRTRLGISTFAILGWNYPVNVETLGQDVVRFAPLVDVISPMAYPATFAKGYYYTPKKDPGSRMYYLVYRTLTGYEKLLGSGSSKLRPWIQGYSVTATDVGDEIKAVHDAGLCGFTVWNASNAYSMTFAALKKASNRPAHCDQ